MDVQRLQPGGHVVLRSQAWLFMVVVVVVLLLVVLTCSHGCEHAVVTRQQRPRERCMAHGGVMCGPGYLWHGWWWWERQYPYGIPCLVSPTVRGMALLHEFAVLHPSKQLGFALFLHHGMLHNQRCEDMRLVAVRRAARWQQWFRRGGQCGEDKGRAADGSARAPG